MTADGLDLLLPPRTPETAPFLDGARVGELRMQRCLDTGRLVFPPRTTSPWGERKAPEWVTVSGRGQVWSVAIPHPPLLPRFEAVAPYNVILVELDEDPNVRLVGNLVREAGAALDSLDPHAIAIGARVRVVFEAVTEEIHLPRWVLDA
jgi:uncharacterized OB-fold protein